MMMQHACSANPATHYANDEQLHQEFEQNMQKYENDILALSEPRKEKQHHH